MPTTLPKVTLTTRYHRWKTRLRQNAYYQNAARVFNHTLDKILGTPQERSIRATANGAPLSQSDLKIKNARPEPQNIMRNENNNGIDRGAPTVSMKPNSSGSQGAVPPEANGGRTEVEEIHPLNGSDIISDGASSLTTAGAAEPPPPPPPGVETAQMAQRMRNILNMKPKRIWIFTTVATLVASALYTGAAWWAGLAKPLANYVLGWGGSSLYEWGYHSAKWVASGISAAVSALPGLLLAGVLAYIYTRFSNKNAKKDALIRLRTSDPSWGKQISKEAFESLNPDQQKQILKLSPKAIRTALSPDEVTPEIPSGGPIGDVGPRLDTPTPTGEFTTPHNAYNVLGHVGRGGMAEVKFGRSAVGTELVALKFLPLKRAIEELEATGTKEDEIREIVLDSILRFEQEYHLGTRFSHPNVAQTLDTNIYEVFADLKGTNKDRAKDRFDLNFSLEHAKNAKEVFIVTQFVPNRPGSKESASTLVAEARKGMLKNRVIDLFFPLFEGLARAHRNGVYHRDLTPKNILLTADEQGNEKLMLIDFGIARSALRKGNITRTGQFAGTDKYRPPFNYKNAADENVDESARLDIYQLGIDLLECLTGENPFKDLAKDEAKYGSWLAQPETINVSGIGDQGLESIIGKMLSPQHEDNYRSMDEVIADFCRLTGRAPHPSGPGGSSNQFELDETRLSQEHPIADEFRSDDKNVVMEALDNIYINPPADKLKRIELAARVAKVTNKHRDLEDQVREAITFLMQ